MSPKAWFLIGIFLISGYVYAQNSNGLYYLEKLEIEKAQSLVPEIPKALNAKVGIISTGINYNLPLISENVLLNAGEVAQNGIDDDGNGYVDDVIGINTYERTSDPMDYIGIGTFSAGLIGGTPRGLLKQVSLIFANPLGDIGVGTNSSVLEAIRYVVSRGAKVVALGLGGSMDKAKLMCDAMEEAQAKKVLFVVSAGNEGIDIDKNPNAAPANCPNDNKIVVATSNDHDELAFYSSFGENTVHVAVPGHDISGFDHLGREVTRSGGSFALTLAAGVAAMALTIDPWLTFQDLKDILYYGTDEVHALKGKVKSGGRLNAYKVLRLATNLSKTPRNEGK